MKFALVNNQRQEATPKTKGICPKCKKTVISKCGTIRVYHWAHIVDENCKNDRWENEGPWHQNWKNQFPSEWQEQPITINNEIHIADIKTPQGLVIEFQHSPIDPKEQKSRESAYKNMIWVVDGARLKNDFYRFEKNINTNREFIFKINNKCKVYKLKSYSNTFPINWVNSSTPVAFDFLGEEKEEDVTTLRKFLYFLLPTKKIKMYDSSAFLFYIPRKEFISIIKNNEWQNLYSKILSKIDNYVRTENIIHRKIINTEEEPYIYEDESDKKRKKRYFNRYNKYRRRF